MDALNTVEWDMMYGSCAFICSLSGNPDTCISFCMFVSLTTHCKINPISLSHCYTLKQAKISGIYPGNLLLFVTRYGNAFFVTAKGMDVTKDIPMDVQRTMTTPGH